MSESADPLGRNWPYRREDGGQVSRRLWPLVRSGDRLDPAGVEAAWGRRALPEATAVRGIVRPAPTPALGRTGSARGGDLDEDGAPLASLGDALGEALDAALDAPGAVLALSGGLDSALLLGLLRARGRRWPTLWTWATDLPGYDESNDARALAAEFGARVEVLQLCGADFVAALPEAVCAAEAPLFNLHPVSRYLFARALAARGARRLVTGDGADQVFAGAPAHLYIPRVVSLAEEAGLDTASPFWAEPSLGWASRHVQRDAGPEWRGVDKPWLRRLALSLGVPAGVVGAPKRPRYAPPVDLSAHWDARRAAALSSELGLALSLDDDAGRVGWTTLLLMSRALEAACAG